MEIRVWELRDSRGRVFAFETSQPGRRGLTRALARVPGVTILRRPRFLSWFREEVFCEFELAGARYECWEPWGDNSRCWVGPADSAWRPETEELMAALTGISS
jgi:hypothetical protein